ncbi:MAG: stage II sporulation protein E [Clostridium sp.]|nr:stage II sporulation protein E [Clostridium sp.]
MKMQSVPYQKLGILGRGYERFKRVVLPDLAIAKNNAVLLILSFLLGRVTLFGNFMPFGLAFYGAVMGGGASKMLVGTAVLLGMLTGASFAQLCMGLIYIAAFTLMDRLFKNEGMREDIRHPFMGLIAVGVPQLMIAGTQGFLIYDILKTLFYAILVFSLIFIFKRGIPAIKGVGKDFCLSSEEAISITMICAIALAGFGDIRLAGVSVAGMLGILVILLMGFRAGSAIGAAVGVIVGLVVSLSNPASYMVIGSYALCGLLAGVFKSLGRVGAALGFIVGNAMLTFYINGSTEMLIYTREMTAAAMIFIIIPDGVIENILGRFSLVSKAVESKQGHGIRIKELTVDRLNNFARAFQELSRTFEEISQTKVVTDNQDISSLFDRVADKVCKDCSLCLHCWDRNFYSTYQVMFRIVETLEKKGWIEECDIPSYFIERCERTGEFIKQVNNIYELFKVDMVWKNRVGESRGLISQQLDGLSNAISNLAIEVDSDIEFMGEMEEKLYAELKNSGIKTEDIIVYQNKWGKLEANITHRGCTGTYKCLNLIEKAASSILGRKMIRDRNECMHEHKSDRCVLKLVEKEAHSVTTGIARISKNENQVSGDNHTFMNIGDGKYILALSDGMGTGKRAFDQSRTAIGLLEQFMETGFEREVAIKLINSILLLKSDEDSFATIDLCAIDLYDGGVEFVKIGAVQSFIKREQKVEVIKTVSLPVGILSDVETQLVCRNIDNGDFIIMVTDGVLDSFNKEGDGEETLAEFIGGIESINPQVIADSILKEAHTKCKGEPIDDMTVLTAKVWAR